MPMMLADLISKLNESEKKKGGPLDQLQDNIKLAIGEQVIEETPDSGGLESLLGGGQTVAPQSKLETAVPQEAPNPGLFAGLKHGLTGQNEGTTVPYQLGLIPGALLRDKVGLPNEDPTKLRATIEAEKYKRQANKDQIDAFLRDNPDASIKKVTAGGETAEVPETEAEFETKLRRTKKQKEMEAEQKLKVPTAQTRNDLSKIRAQRANISNMRKLAEGIPGGYKGVLSIAAGAVTRGAKATNTRLYMKNMASNAVSLYRALTGDTRLSDADAESRALPLLWHPSEDEKVRKKTFDYLEKALEAREELIRQGDYSQDADGNFVTPLEQVLGTADERSQGAEEGDKKSSSPKKKGDHSHLWGGQ